MKDEHLAFMSQVTRAFLTDAVHTIGQLTTNLTDGSALPTAAEMRRWVDGDLAVMQARSQNEGTSFYTKSLPLLGKRLDAALTTGTLDTIGFRSPKCRNGVLLGWLFERVVGLDANLLASPCPIAVKLIRQMTYLYYKYELPYSHAQETKVFEAFIETETELPESSFKYDLKDDRVLDLASRLICNVVSAFNASEINPKHGPGSVATGEEPWEKMRFARIYKPIERYYPFTEWMVPSLTWVVDNLSRLEKLEELENGTAKVVLVPKDSRGPRLISCEPLEYQWIQQGIAQQLVRIVERHRLTAGRVNFTDQEVNRRHALWGSMGTHWVTLDMKDASDRVSLALVRALFGRSHLLEYLEASRSSATRMPDGNVVVLKKFAPMGSALCFPVEALVFWAISVASLHLNTGLRLARALACVKVYGDDIITVAEGCAAVISTLETYNLKVNRTKCCTAGLFRESCGMDAYRGVDVTPIKIRSVWSSNPSCNQIVSFVELSNEFYARGYYEVADYLQRGIDRQVKFPILDHEDGRAYVCYRRRHVVPDFRGLPSRYNPVYQRAEVRTLMSQPVALRRKRPGWELLFKSLINLEQRDSACKAESSSGPTSGTNVQLYPVRGRISLKPRWCLK